jgi:hypothetical protein
MQQLQPSVCHDCGVGPLAPQDVNHDSIGRTVCLDCASKADLREMGDRSAGKMLAGSFSALGASVLGSFLCGFGSVVGAIGAAACMMLLLRKEFKGSMGGMYIASWVVAVLALLAGLRPFLTMLLPLVTGKI